MGNLTIGILVHLLVELALFVRVLTRSHREPAARIAWVAVIGGVPILGILLYLLFGEAKIGRRRAARRKGVVEQLRTLLPDSLRQDEASGLPDSRRQDEASGEVVPERHRHLVATGKSISYLGAVGGNSARLLANSNAAIDSMVADIDAATDHVHLLFYIWLTDNNGCKMVEALKRAAARGVTCRAMADDLGSRVMIRSKYWSDMREAGVRLVAALPIGNLVVRMFNGRVDLRNHRKILVIDGRLTYCGSQNCADPEFLVKAKYAPWVDAVMRFEGPIARQNNILFASDWTTHTEEDLSDVLREPLEDTPSGFPAQVIGTGPTNRFSAMPEMFESLFHAARRELLISTPYFVPDQAMLGALSAAAYRGVETTIIFPARNDSWIVAGASRSYYSDLLEAGVQIFEYVGGLLHAKSLTLDGEVTLIGSANMDRRSFDLNYENNILVFDREVTQDMRRRQQEYLASSKPISVEAVAAWSLRARLWNNTLATVGPIL